MCGVTHLCVDAERPQGPASRRSFRSQLQSRLMFRLRLSLTSLAPVRTYRLRIGILQLRPATFGAHAYEILDRNDMFACDGAQRAAAVVHFFCQARLDSRDGALAPRVPLYPARKFLSSGTVLGDVLPCTPGEARCGLKPCAVSPQRVVGVECHAYAFGEQAVYIAGDTATTGQWWGGSRSPAPAAGRVWGS